MRVLVDTCVWSRVLRHKQTDQEMAKQLEDLIDDARIAMIGPIRQELLSGISDSKQFHRLKDLLNSFEDIPLVTEHFVKAAEFANICRKKGIQGSTIDFLICAVAQMEELLILTMDQDFQLFKKYLPIDLMSL